MSQDNSYPSTVREVLNDAMTFKPAALAALRDFKKSHPWRGSIDERHQKIRQVHQALCAAYGLNSPPRLIFGNDHTTCSGRSCFIPAMNTIVLRGRLSVVTYLHEFAHVRGMGERQATAWSVNLFKRVWPRLFARCQPEGHMLRAPARHDGGAP
jgi:hypothetical protein